MATLPEPQWAPEGQFVEFDPSSICSTNMRFTYMTGMLIRLLEAKFSDPDNIVNPQLKRFVWAPAPNTEGDDVVTKILIEPGYKYEIRNLQMRPGIYVNRGGGQTQDVAIKNKAITHLEKNGNYEGESYLKMIAGTHKILACSLEPMSADQLAEEIFYHLLEYGPVIKKDFMLSFFAVRQLSPLQEIDKEHKEGYVSGVMVEWQTAHAWRLKKVAPILRDVRFVPAST